MIQPNVLREEIAKKKQNHHAWKTELVRAGCILGVSSNYTYCYPLLMNIQPEKKETNILSFFSNLLPAVWIILNSSQSRCFTEGVGSCYSSNEETQRSHDKKRAIRD